MLMAEKTKEQYVSDGLDLVAQGKIHEAIEQYKKALELDPDFVEATLALAKAYELMGALDEAIQILQEAVERHPTEPFLHTSLSQCYVKKGMIAEAEEEMAIAWRLQQNF